MAGMESLGRLNNIIPIAAGQAFKVRGASVIQVIATGATAVVTLNQSNAFGGSFTAFAAIKNIYWNTVTNGTAVWNKLTYAPTGTSSAIYGSPATPLSTYTHGTSAGLTTALTTVFHIFTSELSDPNNYLQVVMGGSGLCTVQPMDLVTARTPANLEILSA